MTTSNIDLTIGALEPTQAIQTAQNSVAMIANRPTVLRIYTKTSTSSATNNVRVSITATRNGANLSGSPLVTGPGRIPTAWSRADINTSFNVRLPQAWLSGQIRLDVRVDSSNAYLERNENNNSASITLNFQTTPTVNIKVVPMNYYDPDEGYYPPAGTAYLAPGMMKIYPTSQVTVSSRAAIDVRCALENRNCWDTVLNTVTTLKKTDNSPETQFYYGVVPLLDDNNDSWFSSGIAGLGWVGGSPDDYYNSRSAIGLADWSEVGLDGGLIAAHEIGHNLGRSHAPCGTTGDGNYPYQGASIGHYGLDIDLLRVISPDDYTDVMSYCDPQWISDYTYNALRTALQTNIGAGPYSGSAASGLLIRAGLSAGQSVSLEPAYAFSGYIDPPAVNSIYAVEFLDERGQVIDSYPVGVMTASEPGIDVQSINALIPLPEAPYVAYRLTHLGETLAQRDLSTQQALDVAAAPPASLTASEKTLLINWSSPQTPAMVRYTVDGGQTWTTLALDQLGGALSVALETLPAGKMQFQIVSADSVGRTWTLDWEK
jgi:hypothetical protein